ncbi:MAG TPA: NADH-ubiquinone oxidoreductase-F iron-sulfur binding region domain-containing protein [Gaiellaceae bacterium]|nr:NADH-ubiquinone oxidoreductase-F iron-sulfur binding region domain-containing protein [Gaiellaceae bacterium]
MTSTAPVRPVHGDARILAGVGRPPTRAEHLRVFGPLEHVDDLAALLAAARLRGRGGAAFPAATKVSAVARAGGRPIVVANAVEGEPASKKDRSVLRVAPHLILDGAAAAARAVGAREILVATTRAAPELAAAIRERVPREDGARFDLRVVPPGFVVGEETALLRALAGGPAKPTLKPPYPAERGLRGRPTLVQNVETLAHVALIGRFGPEWYGRGTTLVTLAGAVARPGVHEVPLDGTLADLLARCGGLAAEPAGILVGGYFGRWVSPDAATSLAVAPELLAAGTIIALPASTCAAAECARVLRYLAGESAGQCGPCTHGLPALADAADPAQRGDGRSEVARIAGLVAHRGACRHPDGAATFVRSALEVFADEYERHAQHRGCGRRDERVLPVGGAAR